jgi:hypothetical protein
VLGPSGHTQQPGSLNVTAAQNAPDLGSRGVAYDRTRAWTFTHLDRPRQRAWLIELARVPNLLDDGWFDAGEDLALAGIAPAGYYRGSFQTREYTERVWSEHVEILEYAEGGMQNYQDLVVARRR